MSGGSPYPQVAESYRSESIHTVLKPALNINEIANTGGTRRQGGARNDKLRERDAQGEGCHRREQRHLTPNTKQPTRTPDLCNKPEPVQTRQVGLAVKELLETTNSEKGVNKGKTVIDENTCSALVPILNPNRVRAKREQLKRGNNLK